jgi:hypothetical protein
LELRRDEMPDVNSLRRAENDIEKLVERFNQPFDPIRHEFEMLRRIYDGLEPLAPEARKRVIEHVVGMLENVLPPVNADQ